MTKHGHKEANAENNSVENSDNAHKEAMDMLANMQGGDQLVENMENGVENMEVMDSSAGQQGGRRRRRRKSHRRKTHRRKTHRHRHGGASALTRLAVPVSLYAANRLMQKKKTRRFVRGVDKSLGRPGTKVIRGVARGFVGTARKAGRLVGLKSKKASRKSRRSRRR